MKWMYYESEDGCPREMTLQQLKEYFENTEGLKQQKREGTTFESWLDEMEKMQILNRKDDDIEEDECTDEENEVYADMQNLKESLENIIS